MNTRIYLFVFMFFVIFVVKCDENFEKIRENLKNHLPDLQITSINAFVIPGIYEIISGNKVFYSDATGRYLVLANIIDLTNKESLTKKRITEISKIDFNSLPFSLSFKLVKGNGINKLAIFTDPNCPFCQSLERNVIPYLDNITIYYFIFPLPIHKNSVVDSQKIICSQNPIDTYLSYIKNDTILPNNSTCTAIKNIQLINDLAIKKLNIQATPTIVLQNGKILTGLPPLDYLNKLILSSSEIK